MSISGFFQFIIGFILGVIFFSAGIAGGVYFFLTRMSANPTKPVFPEEKQEEVKQEPLAKTKIDNSNSTPTKKTVETKPKQEETKQKEEDLPPGAYRARVTWSDGLSLRAEPSQDAERIGGVGYNSELIILEERNREWQKIRVPGSGQEGWVKAGNVAKIN